LKFCLWAFSKQGLKQHKQRNAFFDWQKKTPHISAPRPNFKNLLLCIFFARVKTVGMLNFSSLAFKLWEEFEVKDGGWRMNKSKA